MNKRHNDNIPSIAFAAVCALVMMFSNDIFAQGNKAKDIKNSAISGLLCYKDKNGRSKPVHNIAQWDQKRRQILDSMQMAMGKLPDRSGLPALDIRVTDSLQRDNYKRLTISFSVAENEKVSAFLYVPFQKTTREKLPAMLVLHETGDPGKLLVDGSSPLANRALAKELAQRGYVVIAPDYPGYGDMKDYDFDNDRYESGTMKAIFNHMRCIDLLQAREDVDPERIGVIGHSLGGHNSIFVGAFDQRIKVTVSSCGWTLFDNYNIGTKLSMKYGGRLGPWAQKRYMPLFLDKYKLDGERIPFDFDEVIAAIAPRPFYSNSPLNDSNFDVKGVKKGIAEVIKVYRIFKANDNLQVRYSDAKHDFPPEVRREAYRFIDKILNHTPTADEI